MSELENKYIDHAINAKDLLKRSVEIRHKEQAVELIHDEAIGIVVDLNQRAAAEMEIALEALDENLSSDSKYLNVWPSKRKLLFC